MRDVARELRGLGQEDRRDALQRANDRIAEEVAQITGRDPDDDDVKRILQACGSPESFARYLKQQYPESRPDPTPVSKPVEESEPAPKPRVEIAPQSWALDTEEGKLLGVCAGLGSQFGLDPRFIRFLFVVLLIAGPTVFIAYAGLYFFMRTRTHDELAPPIDWGKVIQASVVYFFVVVAIHVFAGFIITWIVEGYEHPLVSGSFDALSFQWTWIVEERGGLLFWTIAFVMPFAVLSALPLHKAWSKTLAKLAQCSIAIYCAYLAYGVAALLTGIGLDKSGDFEGIDIARLVSDFFNEYFY